MAIALLVQNAEYLKEIESQRKLQCQSKAFLEETERSVPEKLQMPHECAANYERTIRELKLQHNQTLANLKTEMESERILLEEKIGKLKLNVSDVLLEKSRERQKQLQELHKENATLKAEIAALQSQLQIQKTPEMVYSSMPHINETYWFQCTNCQSLEMAVEEKALQLIQKEKMVEELQRFCRKFCKQLTQQDCAVNSFSPDWPKGLHCTPVVALAGQKLGVGQGERGLLMSLAVYSLHLWAQALQVSLSQQWKAAPITRARESCTGLQLLLHAAAVTR
ncbi:hypothetical protein JZ751_010855, partial [Albula glossodonta]